MDHDKFAKFYSARSKSIDKLLFDFMYDSLMKDTKSMLSFIPSRHHEDYEKYIANRTGYGKRYMMATINFKPGVDLEIVKKQMKKCLKKIWIEEYMYCYEIRNEDEEADAGLHIHLKIWKAKNKKSGECKREIYNTFKHLVNNIQCVNMRHSNIDGCFEKYIRGFKNDDKKDCLDISRRYRDENGLEDYYDGINEH